MASNPARTATVTITCELVDVAPVDGLSECCLLPSLIESTVAMTIGSTVRLVNQRFCVDCRQLILSEEG